MGVVTEMNLSKNNYINESRNKSDIKFKKKKKRNTYDICMNLETAAHSKTSMLLVPQQQFYARLLRVHYSG